LADEGAAESEAHIQRGVELRRAGKNGEALGEFQRAYALEATPRARVQIALALQALGDWLGAERGLEEGLQRADDPWIAQYRDALEGALATVRAHLGRLFVEVNAAQGELLLNGVRVHTLPLAESIRVLAGDLEVEARAPGYEPARKTVHVEPGAELRETVQLEVSPPPAAPHGQPSVPLEASPASAFLSRPRRPLAGYLILGGAGALVAGGIVAWRVRENAVGTYNNNTICLLPNGLTRGQQCGSYANTANGALGVEIGAYVGAAIAAGVGAWFVWAPARRTAGTSALLCGPAGRFGLSCEGRF
jgi:hypothetical protein